MNEKTIKIEKMALSNATSRIELVLAQFYIWYLQIDAQSRQVLAANEVVFNYQYKVLFKSFFEIVSTALDVIFNRTHLTATDKLDKFGSVLQFKFRMKDLVELFKNFGYDISEHTVEVPVIDEHNYHDVQDKMILEDNLRLFVKDIIYY